MPTTDKRGRSAANRWAAASQFAFGSEYNRSHEYQGNRKAAALKLVPKERARLAGKLLESLENLSEEENELIWVQEAERRDAAWDSAADGGRTAKRVLRNARAKLAR